MRSNDCSRPSLDNFPGQRQLPARNDKLVLDAPVRDKEHGIDVTPRGERPDGREHLIPLRIAFEDLIVGIRVAVGAEGAGHPPDVEIADLGDPAPIECTRAAVACADGGDAIALQLLNRLVDAHAPTVERVIIGGRDHSKAARAQFRR